MRVKMAGPPKGIIHYRILYKKNVRKLYNTFRELMILFRETIQRGSPS